MNLPVVGGADVVNSTEFAVDSVDAATDVEYSDCHWIAEAENYQKIVLFRKKTTFFRKIYMFLRMFLFSSEHAQKENVKTIKQKSNPTQLGRQSKGIYTIFSYLLLMLILKVGLNLLLVLLLLLL